MDAPAEHAERREEGSKSPERRGPSFRGRGEPGGSGGGSRPSQEPRRKRGSEQRYAGFGDGIERAFCTQATHFLPRTFPVESHAGAATIRREVVARRPDALLLCTFSHCGAHVWPDGEVVMPPQDAPDIVR